MDYSWLEDFYRIAHYWEQQAQALSEVRSFNLGDNNENIALLSRQKSFERCASELRSAAKRSEEIFQTVKQQTNGDAKPKLPKR